MSSEVRVRIAPSPTGQPHLGTAYIALFNRCFAKQQGGTFILRIEDTDRTRSTPESEAAIFASLRWLGLDWDEGPDVGGRFGPYRQSERSDLYREHAQILLDRHAAYRCFCPPERLAALREEQKAQKLPQLKYDRRCLSLSEAEVQKRLEDREPHVLRLRVPDGSTTYDDRLRGPITFANETIDDQVLLKSDGFPTYHLANVVDDHLMRISHVCRAEEWITSTPKHVLLYSAFAWPMPVFIHMPLLRNRDRSKISKRKNPVSLTWYRDQGYLPEALLNFLALMGFSLGDDREVFTIDEMTAAFSWDRVRTGEPVFDLDKLDWLNGLYIRNLGIPELADRLAAFDPRAAAAPIDLLRRIAPLVQERLKKLSDLDAFAGFFFDDALHYDPALLVHKKATPDLIRDALAAALLTLGELDTWDVDSMEAACRALCESRGWAIGPVFMALRVAVTGRTATPPLFECMELLGRETCLTRVQAALDRLAEA
ncbi:glutamate--tRNA ligase [Planctomycetota bacterium]